jgi:DNA-binding MarR family transcriptional regulator
MCDATDIADRLHSAAIHLLRRVRREDAMAPVTPAQASALSVLVFAGPLTVGDLADAEQVRSPTMTRVVDQLARHGLADREAVATDGRRTLVRATDAGLQLIAEGRQRRVAFLAHMFESLPTEDLNTLRRAANLLADVLELSRAPDSRAEDRR